MKIKIKCPLCKKELMCRDSDEYDLYHLYAEHGWEGGLTSEYADLIFKIHEKIESIGKEKPDFTSLHGKTMFQRKMGALQELKSLLENEK